MNVLLVQIDGKLPNLALMKLGHWHRSRGDTVRLTKRIPPRGSLGLTYGFDRVYGSAIFGYSAERVQELRETFPHAIVGGTWDSFLDPMKPHQTVEQLLGVDEYENYDWSLYPDFESSIGFTSRGCRFKCGHCCVPRKEGKPRQVNTIASLWRGEPHPRHIHLLDNDFFGVPRDQWSAIIKELNDGDFRVCLNQGVNIWMIDDETAAAIAQLPYYDDQFKTKRLYTAWDNIKAEDQFFRGVELLKRHKIPPSHLMVYMLIGYDKAETWETVFRRFNRMVEMGMRPYPMPYNVQRDKTLPLGGCNQNIAHRTLGEFQRYVIRRAYRLKPPVAFEDYDVNARGIDADDGQLSIFAEPSP